MYAVLAFDTEDVYFPPEYGIDDVPGWLAEIMTECQIRGTFFVMGEKARSMKARGRTDVLERMAASRPLVVAFDGLERVDASLAQLLYALYPIWVFVFLSAAGHRVSRLAVLRLGLTLPVELLVFQMI